MSNSFRIHYPKYYPGYKAIAERGENTRLMILSKVRDSIYETMVSGRMNEIDLKEGSLPDGFSSIIRVELKGKDIFVCKEIIDIYRVRRTVSLNLMTFSYDAAWIIMYAIKFQEQGMEWPADYTVPNRCYDIDYFDEEHPIVKSEEEIRAAGARIKARIA